MKNTILNNLLHHFYEVKPLVTIYNHNDRFKEDLCIDSLDMAEFIARVEQDYRVEIPDEDWSKIVSMNLLVDYIHDVSRN